MNTMKDKTFTYSLVYKPYIIFSLSLVEHWNDPHIQGPAMIYPKLSLSCKYEDKEFITSHQTEFKKNKYTAKYTVR